MSDSVRRAVAGEARAVLARHQKTQRDLAAVLGLSQTQAWARLTGAVGFRADEVARIAAWLEIPVTDLLSARVVQIASDRDEVAA